MRTQGLTLTREEMRNLLLCSPNIASVSVFNYSNPMLYILYDYTSGSAKRLEIPVGSGIVRVCIGHKIGKDGFGNRTRFPIFRDFNSG